MAKSIPELNHTTSVADGPVKSVPGFKVPHSFPDGPTRSIFDPTFGEGLPGKQQSVLNLTGSTLTASTGVSTPEVTDFTFGATPIFEETSIIIGGTQSGDTSIVTTAVSEETDIAYSGVGSVHSMGFLLGESGTTNGIGGVAYGAGVAVATIYTGDVITSTDGGVTWSTISVSTTETLTH